MFRRMFSIEKRAKEVLGIIKESPKCDESHHRMTLERGLVDLHKLFMKENQVTSLKTT